VPLRWDELGGSVRPDTYDIGNVRRRLAHLDGEPWDGYFALKQTITPAMLGELGLDARR
jgi:bifunctional non-homologous end joining protein LigD